MNVESQNNENEELIAASEPSSAIAPSINKSNYDNYSISLATIISDVTKALVEDLSPDVYDLANSTTNNHNLLNIQALAKEDVTASLIDDNEQAHAHVITREDIVLCGRDWAHQAFLLIDPALELTWHYDDSESIAANSPILEIKGSAKAILTAERTALNFLQMLSGTATTTARYVKYLAGSSTSLLDTRKTIPSFRQAQKYAVSCGGGKNHRVGLYDAFLIKENHIKACGSITNAISKAKALQTKKPVEIEVESLEEFSEAIAAGPDIIMLDNFSTEQIQRAVSLNNNSCKLEVSGNITEERLLELANTRVDYVSSGAITKHVTAVDLSLLIL